LTNPVNLIVENCFFFGGDFADYNSYNNKGSQYFALSGPITNCWGIFHNCSGMVIGNMEGSEKRSTVIGGTLELTNPCKGELTIYGSYISSPVATELVATSNIKLINSFSAALEITMVAGSQLKTEQISPNISVIGSTSGWVHNGEKLRDNFTGILSGSSINDTQGLAETIDSLSIIKEAISITYENLVILKNASGLIVGQKYLITDFVQSYNIFDGGTMAIIEEKIGGEEPIIVTASKVNELYKVAISTLYPQDIIYYSLDILDIRDIGFGYC